MIKSYAPLQMQLTKYLFFTGKGGVGKTSIACATAVSLADQGKRVLLVSTDPASNLQDVFHRELNSIGIAIDEVPNLVVANLDPEEAAREYRNKVIGPYKGKLPEAIIKNMEEQLSGSCTVEIAAFNEFSNFITNQEIKEVYDYILFDTAPTGHTLRMLQLPSAWSSFIGESTHGASCLGQLSGLEEKKEVYKNAVNTLIDRTQTTLVLITRPESAPLKEAHRASLELRDIGVSNQILIFNGVLNSCVEDDLVSSTMFARQNTILNSIPEELKALEIFQVPLRSYNITGINQIRKMLHTDEIKAEPVEVFAMQKLRSSLEKSSVGLFVRQVEQFAFGKIEDVKRPLCSSTGKSSISASCLEDQQDAFNETFLPSYEVFAMQKAWRSHSSCSLDVLIEDMYQSKKKVIFTMGKGGVGKTTMATEIALGLVKKGIKVHLTTTDPANHLNEVIQDIEGLTLSKIDEKIELEKYKEDVLKEAKLTMGDGDLAYIEEDLKSPCTQEIAVFRAFAEVVDKADNEVVVIDTAPTGHTLLLLDATQSYHREVQRTSGGNIPESLRKLLPRLRDASETEVVIVTLPEATPVHEASRLYTDLKRAGLHNTWWIINASISVTHTTDPLLNAKAHSEIEWINKVNAISEGNFVVIPWRKET